MEEHHMQRVEIEDEAGNIDLCVVEGTRILRVVHRIKSAPVEPEDSGTYAAQYAYACGYHD
jgi:hypothetical protein